jgi:hypothetical protein
MNDNIAIYAADACTGEVFAQCLDDPLGTGAQHAQIDTATAAAATRNSALSSAMVTTQALSGAMIDHACIAVRTSGKPTALMANHERRVAATVYEQQRLLAASETIIDAL